MQTKAEARFRDFLAARGLRLTRERRRVVRFLFEGSRPLDPEALLSRSRRLGEPVSRATLYRTLELLVKSGLVRHRVPGVRKGGAPAARYEQALSAPRQGRLVCLSCGRLIEIFSPGLRREQNAVCARLGFLPQHLQLEVFGLCRNCRKDGSASRRRRERRADGLGARPRAGARARRLDERST